MAYSSHDYHYDLERGRTTPYDQQHPPLHRTAVDDPNATRPTSARSRKGPTQHFSKPNLAGNYVASPSPAPEEWPPRPRRSSDGATTAGNAFAAATSPTMATTDFATHNKPPLPIEIPHPAYRSDVLMQSPRKSKSMDIMDAAGQLPWQQEAQQHPHNPYSHEAGQNPFRSTRSLVSTIREKSSLPVSTFAQRVFEAGKPDLLYDLRQTKRLKDRRHGVLDLTTLQRMNQHVLQQKLVEQVKALGERGAWMEIGIRETLHEYCDIVRDLEYMETRALRSNANDPFMISTKSALDSLILEDAGLVASDPSKILPAGSAPVRFSYTRRLSAAKQRMRRLLMALVGGVALIAPFLIMSLIAGELARLVTTCAAIVLVAVVLAVGSEMGPDRLGLITAAYAAALIVFVGTNPPTYVYTT